MQDRYAGDIGDYGKFGMLRALASKGLSIGVNWYKVETLQDELGTNDGGKLIPTKLATCDEELAAALRAVSMSACRSIELLEAGDLVPGARYWSFPVPVEGRARWHEGALSCLANTDVVFLDPDNGLLVKSVGKRSAKSPKYTFYEEVADYVLRGQSVVVYNHRSRKAAGEYFGEIHQRLRAAVPDANAILAITFPRGSVRDYFAVCASAEHAALVRDAFEGLASGAWGKAGMCRIQPLPAKVEATVDLPSIIGFWKPDGPYGCLSNWHLTGFDFRGTHFATSEHWMMWQKARVLGDDAMAEQILEVNTPDGAKYLGGKAAPFHKVWDHVREQMVYYGVREKFLQNAPERELLLSTGSALLAEASPLDRDWGVGMAADDPSFANPAKWKGDNLQGRVCMRVRADLRQLQAMRHLGELADTYVEPNGQIAHMTLLQLSRIPATRAAVNCYAQIVSHALPNKYPTPGSFLKKEHSVTVKDITQLIDSGKSNGLPITCWYELVRELCFQQALGKL